MADFRVRVISIAVAATCAAVACGSRSGDYLGPGQVDGVGFGPGGVGGVSGTGGVGGSPANVSNEASTSVGTTDGFAVAVTGSWGGSSSTGDSCVPGVCQCFDCFSACLCNGSSTVSCEDRCFGNEVTVSGPGFGFSVSNSVTSSVSAGGSPMGFSVSSSSSSGGAGGAGGATSSCCEVGSSPGCDDPVVEQCVCDLDPFCCNHLWDGFCVQEVESRGCGSCGTSMGGAGGNTQSVVTSAGGASSSGSITVSSVTVSSVTGSSSTTGEGGSGGVAECVAQSQSNCEACLCADCFQEYGDCVGDFGCPKILECIDEAGCSGLDCYTPDTCQKVIDKYGGLAGASVAYVTGLIECAVSASCPCP